MNKHMKKHSQRLNIKTTQLASLTAIFHSKKRRPPAADDPHLSAMDVDKEGSLPRPDSQIGGSEAIPKELTTQFDGSETDNSDGSDGDGTNRGLLVDSDSGDEFESDEDSEVEAGIDRGPLEFELRAVEAGSVLC